MALKPDRSSPTETHYDISFFCNTVAEAGGVVCGPSGLGTAASGSAMDSSSAVVEYAATPSGRYPIGVLLNNFVNKDLTQQTLNPYKSERQIGDKATVMTKGWVVTNFAGAGLSANILPGQTAYLGASGNIIHNTVHPLYGASVGRFMSKVDQEGYFKVKVDL